MAIKISYPNDNQLIDLSTGEMTVHWQRFFQDLYNFVNNATTTGGKVAFLGKDAITQQAKIADPTGGGPQDSEARSAIDEIIDLLENFGFSSET